MGGLAGAVEHTNTWPQQHACPTVFKGPNYFLFLGGRGLRHLWSGIRVPHPPDPRPRCARTDSAAAAATLLPAPPPRCPRCPRCPPAAASLPGARSWVKYCNLGCRGRRGLLRRHPAALGHSSQPRRRHDTVAVRTCQGAINPAESPELGWVSVRKSHVAMHARHGQQQHDDNMFLDAAGKGSRDRVARDRAPVAPASVDEAKFKFGNRHKKASVQP